MAQLCHNVPVVYLFSALAKRILRAPCASIYEAVECIISRLMQLHASLTRMVLRENGNRTILAESIPN